MNLLPSASYIKSFLICTAASLVVLQASSAQTLRTWTGATDTDFATGTNWSTGVAPISTTVGLFQGDPSSVLNMPTLSTNTTINGLSFTSAAGGWTISSNSGTFLISATNGSLYGISTIGQTSGTNTIDAGIETGVTSATVMENWSVGTGGTLILNGNIASTNTGSGSIVQIGTSGSGAGTLVLNGTNTRVGETQLAAGTVQMGVDNAFGSGTLTVLDSGSGGVGATLTAAGAARTLNNAVTLGTGVSLTLGGANNVTFGGILSGGGSLAVSLTGTTILTQNNTFTGSTSVNSGATLQLGNGSIAGSLGGTAAGIILNSGGTLAIDRSNPIGINTTNNPLSGSGLIQNIGSGTTTFTGSSSFNGDVQVSNGTVVISQINALGGNANTGKVTVDTGAQIQYGSLNSTRSGDMINNGTVILSNASTANGMTFISGKTASGNGTYEASALASGVADFSFGGTVAPGATPDTAGTFTFGNGTVGTGVQFLSTSTIVWNLTGMGGVAGTDYDTFDLLGGSSASLVGGAQLDISLAGISFDGSNAYWQTSHSFTLFSTDSVTGTLDMLDNVYSDSFGTGTFTFDGQDIDYTFAAVPEPATTGLLAISGVLALILLRRRRRAS